MGLFDGYQFSPSSFTGSGGLLSSLPSWLYQNQQGPGFGTPDNPLQYGQTSNEDIGGYKMPVFGQGDPATLPTNAQPTAGAPAQPAPQTEAPGIGDRLVAGLSSFAQGGRNGGLIGALTGAATGLASGVSPENQTVKALVARGLDASTAQTVARDPSLLRSVLPQLMGTAGQTNDIKEYEYAKRQGFKGTLDQWMAQKRAGAGEYSLTPVYGTNDKGETVLVQPGKSGTAIQTVLPPGVKISAGVEKIDLGTQWGVLDKKSGQIIGYQPKDIQGKEAAEARGKAQGEAQVALPGAVSDAEQTTKKINDLLDHKGLDSIVGSFDQFRPAWSLSAEGKDALARYNQLKGTAFLQAYGLLRGGGAITEIEGVKAENAMARMDRSQSEGEFKAALKDFRDAVQVGLQKIRTRAGQGGQPDAASAAPAQNNLKQKYGLD